MRFRAAGLTIAAPCPIPGFKRSSDSALSDITLSTAATPPWAGSRFHLWHASDDTDARGTPNVSVSRASEGFRFVYADDARFWIAAGGRHIWMTWATTFEDACTYLAGPVLAFVLRLRGSLALHASAVQIDDHGALAIVGPHGAGKSTTAAALGRRGCRVIADDVLCLTDDGDRWLAHADGAVLRLWPTASELVFGDAGRLPRITGSWDKRVLILGEHGVTSADQPVPLDAVAFLDTTAGAGRSRVVPLDAADAFMRLVANSSATQLLDVAQRAAEFGELEKLARSMRSALALVPPAMSDAAGFCDQLLDWARG